MFSNQTLEAIKNTLGDQRLCLFADAVIAQSISDFIAEAIHQLSACVANRAVVRSQVYPLINIRVPDAAMASR